MTENEAIGQLKYMYKTCMDEKCKHKGQCDLCCESKDMAIQALEEIQQYRAIGTVEEFKALKKKNTPKELAEHNFQDEVHHYLCPSCRSIVNCNQNYCEECGQALET